MNKRTGDLFEAYRVCFLDRATDVNQSYNDTTRPFVIGLLQHDGWVVIHPGFNGPAYFNHSCDEIFENLGEL